MLENKNPLELYEYYKEIGNYRLAFLNAKKSAYSHQKEGYRKLGYCYQFGIGTNIDISSAIYFYKLGADLLDLPCLYNLGKLLLQKDDEEGLFYLKKGADLGHVKSMTLYASSLEKRKQYSESLKYYELAYEYGDTAVLDNIGLFYYYGYGLSIDYKKAFETFFLSSSLNNPISMYHLGVMYFKGEGVDKSYERAFYWYLEGSKFNEMHCLYNLGSLYEYGLYIDKDLDKARYYYKRSEEAGFSLAKDKLDELGN